MADIEFGSRRKSTSDTGASLPSAKEYLCETTVNRYVAAMSGTNVEPETLRPELHRRIDPMGAEQPELLRRTLLKLELAEVADSLHETFDATRRSGTLDRLDEIIREVRADHPYA